MIRIVEITARHGVRVAGEDAERPIPEAPLSIFEVPEADREVAEALSRRGPIPTVERDDTGRDSTRARERLEAFEAAGFEGYLEDGGMEDATDAQKELVRPAYEQELARLRAAAGEEDDDEGRGRGRGRRRRRNDDDEPPPRETRDILADIRASVAGLVVTVGDGILVPRRMGDPRSIDMDRPMRTLSNANDLIAWVEDDFNRGWSPRPNGKTVAPILFSNLKDKAKPIGGVAHDPHEPPLKDRLYLCPLESSATPEAIRAGVEALTEFASMHSFEKGDERTEDRYRALYIAYCLTVFWGGEGGTRPLFIFTSKAGPDSGKSTAARGPGVLLEDRKAAIDMVVEARRDEEELEAEIANRIRDGHEIRLFGKDNLVPNGPLFDRKLAGQLHSEDVNMRAKFGRGQAKMSNTLTAWITLNADPNLSTELATRAVNISMGERGGDNRTFASSRAAFAAAHRSEIRAAAIAALKWARENPPTTERGSFRFPEWEDTCLYAACRFILGWDEEEFRKTVEFSAGRRKDSNGGSDVVRRIGAALVQMMEGDATNRHWSEDAAVYIPKEAVDIAARECGYYQSQAPSRVAEFFEALKKGNGRQFRYADRVPNGLKFKSGDHEGETAERYRGALYFGPYADRSDGAGVKTGGKYVADGEVTLSRLKKHVSVVTHKSEWIIEDLGRVTWRPAADTLKDVPADYWVPRKSYPNANQTTTTTTSSTTTTSTTTTTTVNPEDAWSEGWNPPATAERRTYQGRFTHLDALRKAQLKGKMEREAELIAAAKTDGKEGR